MKQSTILTLLAILFSVNVSAAPVSKSKAAQIAAKYMYGMSKTMKKLSALDSRRMRSPQAQFNYTTIDDAYYAFNASDGKGFVIISGDDALPEVVGYSKGGSIDVDNMSDGLRFYLDCYTEYVRQVRLGNITPAKAPEGDFTPVVDTLIVSQWNQTYPYNKYAPEAHIFPDKYNNKFPIGCVAIAFAQVMKYWNWPKAISAKGDKFVATFAEFNEKEQVVGKYTSTLDVNALPYYEYDWDNMPDNYLKYDNSDGVENFEEKAEAIAVLLRDVAYSLSMDWGLAGGGTFSQSDVLTKYFGYSKDCHNIKAVNVEGNSAGDAWMNLIKSNLDNKYPIIYNGQASTGGGHCFIFDGYDAGNRVHVNWGWGGKDNAWYDVTCLNTHRFDLKDEGDYNFSFDNSMITNLHPNYDGKEETCIPQKGDVRGVSLGCALLPSQQATMPVELNLSGTVQFFNKNNVCRLATMFFIDQWRSGIDFDYRYVITADNDTIDTIVKNNVMGDYDTTPYMSNTVFVNTTAIPDVFGYEDGDYELSCEFNIHNDKGDETGWNAPSREIIKMDKLYLQKEGNQCILTFNLDLYNPIYSCSVDNENEKYYYNIFSLDDLDDMVEGDSTIVCMDINIPYVTSKTYDRSASTDIVFQLKNNETGDIVMSDVKSFEEVADYFALFDEEPIFFYNKLDYVLHALEGTYTLTIECPYLKIFAEKEFTVGDSPVTGIKSVNAASNDGRLYNLAGQRVGNDYRGITVNGGSKYIKK